MKFVYKHGIKKFTQFASRVWGVDSYFNEEEYMALEGIRLLESFYKDIGLPTRLSEIKITSEKFEEMANKCIDKGLVGNFIKLDSKDIVKIYKLAL